MDSLSSVILLPLLSAFLILLVPGNYRVIVRAIAVLGSGLTAWIAASLFFRFQPGHEGFQFESILPWISVGKLSLAYHVGADGLNIGLILVTGLVGFASVLVSWNIDRNPKLFYILLLLMIGGALGAFASLDLLFFYFFNELALVPTFILIGVWGRGENKTVAAFKITLYLTLGALIALAGLLLLHVSIGAQTFDVIALKTLLSGKPLSSTLQNWIFPLLLFGFGTLVGLFPFHSWAAEGYAAAPTAAAMMHSGILKKAGLYALLRVALPFLPDGAAHWLPVLAWLCLGNLLHCGWVALRQKDLNLLIGNSSLAHMGFAFLGIASLSVIGITGTVIVMVAHALLAALCFALSGYLESQSGTVDMTRLGGLLRRMPVFGTLMVMGFMAGCGLPGFANFAGEATVLFGSWKSLPWIVVAASWSGLILGAVYMLRALRSILYGEERKELAAVIDLGWWRRLPFALLIAALLLFGVAPSLLSRRIEPVAKEIVKAATNRSTPSRVAAVVVTP
ncbi:MAG: NADH-quinone oxidoreductase subunit M [Pedosphaera sp.]|nr:NADH-quinone oxidoreductase subunit M [Pedosphaera sp.]